MVIVSHLHNDHFDNVAQRLIPKDLPLPCQPSDGATIAEVGFRRVLPVREEVVWEGITITRTPGMPGIGVWGERLNPVSGFVLRAEGEPTVYWCGDTIGYEAVQEIVERVRPDVIITHSGGAEIQDSGLLLMDVEQTIAVVSRGAAGRGGRGPHGGVRFQPDLARRPARCGGRTVV